MTDGSAWTLDALKQYVDSRFDEAIRASELSLNATDARLELLNEFRRQSADRDENFARLADLDNVKQRLDAITSDHVRRVEFEDIKIDLAQKSPRSDVNSLKDSMLEGRGRRTAGAAAIAVVVFALSLLFGYVLRAGITSADVSDQIQKEAPWNRDKPIYTARIASLEKQISQNEVDIARLQALELSQRNAK